MATSYQMRAVRYDLLGARRGVIADLGLTVNVSESDAPQLGSLQVAAAESAGFGEVIEVGVEVFDGTAWVEPDGCRFIAVADDANENDPANVKTYRGEGLWSYVLGKGALEDTPQRSITNASTASKSGIDNIGFQSNWFTKTNHGLQDGERVLVRSTGSFRGASLEVGQYLYVRHVEANRFRLSGAKAGASSFKSTGDGDKSFTGISLRPAQPIILAPDHGFTKHEKVRFVSVGNALNVKTGEDYYVSDHGTGFLRLAAQRGGEYIDLGPSASGLTLFVTLDGKRKFTNLTPGRLVRNVMGEAVARGWAPPALARAFTAETDSDGAAWAETVDIEFNAGMSIWTIIRSLVEAGVCRVEFRGRALRLLNPLPAAPALAPTVKLGTASQVQVQRSYDDAISHATVRGENRIIARAAQGLGPLAPLGRLEEYERASGVVSTKYAQRLANQAAAGRGGIGRGYIITADPHQDGARRPLLDYEPGQYVTFAQGGTNHIGLVLEVQLRKSSDATITATSTLEKKRTAKQLRALRKTTKATGGTSLAGGAGLSSAVVVSGAVPAAPALTVVPVAATFTASGASTATARAAVTAVAATIEGAEIAATITEVFVRPDGQDAAQSWATIDGTALDLTGLQAGATYYVSARAIAEDGTAGVLSDEVELVTQLPASLLLPPSAPLVVSQMAVVSVQWDGLMRSSSAEGGTTTPTASLARVVAQLQQPDGSWADAGQQLASGGQAAQLDGLAVGSTVTVRLVAIDTAGNRSDPSPSVTVTVEGVDVTALGEEIRTELGKATDALLAAEGLSERIDDEVLPAIDAAAASPITDARLQSGSLSVWPFAENVVPAGAIAPGAVGSTEIADFALTVKKLRSDRHHLY